MIVFQTSYLFQHIPQNLHVKLAQKNWQRVAENIQVWVNELKRYVKSQTPIKLLKTGLFIDKCMKLNTETLLKYCILQIFNRINFV